MPGRSMFRIGLGWIGWARIGWARIGWAWIGWVRIGWAGSIGGPRQDVGHRKVRAGYGFAVSAERAWPGG